MRILVVDDEPAVRNALQRTLAQEGYDVALASDGTRALAAIGDDGPDAVVLDVMMPGLDGIEVTRRLRAMGDSTPVLLLTARQGVSDRVEGLDAGADDYLTKPFALEELLARVRVLLRRAVPDPRPEVVEEQPEELRFEDLTLDLFAHRATRAGRPLDLTRTEFSLLELFMRNPGRVLSRSSIYEQVWGYDFGPTSNSLDVYIGYLRRKTEAGDEPRLVQTVRGVGFVLRRE